MERSQHAFRFFRQLDSGIQNNALFLRSKRRTILHSGLVRTDLLKATAARHFSGIPADFADRQIGLEICFRRGTHLLNRFGQLTIITFGVLDARYIPLRSRKGFVQALQNHLQILELQKSRIDDLIRLVGDRISGKQQYAFEAFSTEKIMELQEKFREEVIERWGDTKSYREYAGLSGEKARKIQQDQWDMFLANAKDIFEHLAEHEDKAPPEREVQSIVRQWKACISENFYQCDNQMLMNLGALYVTDERFKGFINRFGNGNLADFFYKAIKAFCTESDQ